MSLGQDWKRRLQADQRQFDYSEEEKRLSAIKERARKIIAEFERSIGQEKEHRHLVMKLNEGETRSNFKELYGRRFTSSDEFLGAAKIVVEYCLTNDFDVYVWEYDFKMSIGPFGAEIWVTPHGVPYHLSEKP